MNSVRRLIPVIYGVLLLVLGGVNAGAETALPWHVWIDDALASDAGIRAAVEDIQQTGAALGEVVMTGPIPDDARQVIVVGGGRSDGQVPVVPAGAMTPPEEPQGFTIRTFHHDGRRTMVVAGGSEVGNIYGLYWIWDRMRVHWKIPDINVTRVPAMKVRHVGGRDSRALRQAIRYTANWVSDYDVLNLVPWGVEPEDTANAAARAALAPLLEEAHGLHLKYLVYCDEFSYHPDWLAAQGATLDLDDPNLWAALQAKYRALFRALPALDGVRIRTGEHTRVGGNYRPQDVMHEPENEDWPLDRRYRTFVQKLHDVVVGEFDKIYFHRTWVANAAEQHSDPSVFRAIFTDDVPTENLWLSPYMSLADRWYYQPYNPTFNLTPHNMVVLLATLDYHAAGNAVFPSFPGNYFQGGMLSVLDEPGSNLKGVHFGLPVEDGWNTASLTGYVAFRLAWEPWVDLDTVARDYASMHLGPAAASEMVRAIQLSQQAYKDGIYIKPVAEGITGNTLPHLRLTTFPVQGIPQIDDGKAHIDWLRQTLYEPCRGREEETLAYLALGLAAARVMEQAAARSHPLITAPPAAGGSARDSDAGDDARSRALADRVVREAVQTRWLVETNVAYVRTCLAYFAYRETPDTERRVALAESVDALEATRSTFVAVEAFSYKLYGIDQLIANVKAVLEDLDDAARRLEAAPDEVGVQSMFRAQQAAHRAELLKPDHGLTRVLRWRGQVDGKDILHIRGDSVRIEHLAYDDIQSASAEFFAPLPERPVEIVVRDVESQGPHPYVLSQPSAENDYTASIYLYNSPPGYNWWEFEVFIRE